MVVEPGTYYSERVSAVVGRGAFRLLSFVLGAFVKCAWVLVVPCLGCFLGSNYRRIISVV